MVHRVPSPAYSLKMCWRAITKEEGTDVIRILEFPIIFYFSVRLGTQEPMRAKNLIILATKPLFEQVNRCQL